MLREIAEYPNSFGPLGPNSERIETDRYTLCMGPGKTWNTVQRQRMRPDEIDDVLDETRSLLRERGRTKTQWEVGSSAEPPDLVEQLLERGLTWDKEPYAVALVLTTEPPRAAARDRRAPRRDVRRVRRGERRAVGGVRACRTTRSMRRARCSPKTWQDTVNVMHAAWLDGELVAAGTSAPTEHGLLLYGGATAPHARGRGAYRALLNARWQEAVGNGTPALITQGGAMSRPILERLGFERVGEIHMLLDEFGA